MAEEKNNIGNNLQEGSMFIPLDNSKDGDIALKEIRDVVVDNEKFFTEKGVLITELKEGNKGLKETNDWLKNIYNSLTREKSVNTGGYSSIDPVLLGSIMTQKTAGFENVLENLQRSISPIFQKTNQNLEGLYRIGKDEGSDRKERKKLTKSQNENSFRFKDFIKEKGGFSRAILGLGASVKGTSVKTVAGIGKGLKNLGGRIIAGFLKVMGSSLWEIIKTILFLLLFDPEGSFVKSIGKFMLRIADKIWDSLPDWLKDVFANINVFLSRIISKILWLGSYIVDAIAWVVSVIKNDEAAQWLRESAERMRAYSEYLDVRNERFEVFRDLGNSAFKSLELANAASEREDKKFRLMIDPEKIRAEYVSEKLQENVFNTLSNKLDWIFTNASRRFAHFVGGVGEKGVTSAEAEKRRSALAYERRRKGWERSFTLEDWAYVIYGESNKKNLEKLKTFLTSYHREMPATYDFETKIERLKKEIRQDYTNEMIHARERKKYLEEQGDVVSSLKDTAMEESRKIILLAGEAEKNKQKIDEGELEKAYQRVESAATKAGMSKEETKVLIDSLKEQTKAAQEMVRAAEKSLKNANKLPTNPIMRNMMLDLTSGLSSRR